MGFKPLTIILLLATGYFHYNVLAFPAPVNPYAPSQTSETTEGSSAVVLADVTTGPPPGANGLATVGGDPTGKNFNPDLTGKTPEAGPKTGTPNGKDGKNGGTKAAGADLTKTTTTPGPGAPGGKNSKTAGLTQAELVEACAPLLGKTAGPPGGAPGGTPGGKNDSPVLGKTDVPALGGKTDSITGGKGDAPKNGGAGVVGGKNATAAGKASPAPRKSSASIFMRSSVVTTALPIILSTGVGLLVP